MKQNYYIKLLLSSVFAIIFKLFFAPYICKMKQGKQVKMALFNFSTVSTNQPTNQQKTKSKHQLSKTTQCTKNAYGLGAFKTI